MRSTTSGQASGERASGRKRPPNCGCGHVDDSATGGRVGEVLGDRVAVLIDLDHRDAMRFYLRHCRLESGVGVSVEICQHRSHDADPHLLQIGRCDGIATCDDTVEQFDPYSGSGTGFKLWDLSVDSLVETVAAIGPAVSRVCEIGAMPACG